MKDTSLVGCLVMCTICLPFSMDGNILKDQQAHLYDYFKGDLRCMPPTEDTLMQHVLRAFKQINISKSAHLFQ